MSCMHNRRSGRVSCTRHWRFRKYACLCEDGAMSNQRIQQIKMYHHVHLRWLWSNSVRHLMMRTCCLSRHPFRSLTHMQQLWSPNTRIFLSFCYKAHSHQFAMMSISYLSYQRQQYSEMPRRHRSVFVPQHSFRTCLWGSVTPLHVCTTSARMYHWREYICRWHVHAEREELLGHDCRNHYNCCWAIMLSWR